ncbi:RecQ family ATP-dependent DNA helicase [Armatimonas rosea]|uniref:ATP-dependent DNA helicase RecQ n=1 Tax=Armatimonas rosea TaxID=685828 RepID=A0A7W9SU34_ARMRO|nr:ATP-dependent DNA helicase RecQ [Armatimonas rosea]MBB6052841.1 ATP-dependent DNA helicase RecQ [Armatimonas rosea]
MNTNITQLLEKYFGFSAFRPGQEQVVETLLAGRSALAVFPTGGGKSLCYQLPALCFDGVTIVVSPLIALMKDQIDFLTARGIAAARLDSSLSLDEVKRIGDGLADGSLRLLYVSPERFNNERFLGQLQRTKISLFAIDEAHCISEWGHNFRPDYLKLADAAKRYGAERVLALTATATPQVVKDIHEAFGITPDDGIVTGFYRPNLELVTTPVTATERDTVLLRVLKQRPPGPTIVYVTLQKTAERLAELLSEAGLPAEPYHAGMEDEARSAVQERWMASDKGIVVATIAFGMGIDKSNVRYVYHYNLPKSLESYSQEIGRAGRDGQPSVCHILACLDDVPTLENFVFGDTPTRSALHSLLSDLLSRGLEFDIALYDLSVRHDIRQLVLKTILTYLELNGILRQGTPFYAAYEFRPLPGQTAKSIAAAFPEAHRTLVENIFEAATKGRLWYKLNPEDASLALAVERGRIVRVLEVLEERGHIELRTADVRQRFYRLNPSDDTEALTDELDSRFALREKNELARLAKVVKLIGLGSCQTNALTGYFGERRTTPCGHCSFCLTGEAQRLPESTPPHPIPASLRDELTALRDAHPDALREDRQLARFLCGISSPAVSKARIGRHKCFGILEDHPFGAVLGWLSTEL